MEHRRSLLFLGISLLASSISAQQIQGQGVLVDGNSQLPACAQTCGPLTQAAQACTATTGSATQANWICFCQSAYLLTLRSSAVGVCDTSCTDPTDNAQVSTWYSTNCGSDNGATNHADDGTTTDASTGGDSSSDGTSTGSSNTNSNSNSGSSSNNAQSGTQAGSNPASNQTWWEGHYKWIIMVIVLALLLGLFAWLLTFLKKRHDRNRDKITGCFNAGITKHNNHFDHEKGGSSNNNIPPNTLHPSSASGRNSPARTREAFMPYGYGYTSSESRVGSRTDVADRSAIPLEEKKSPLAREVPVIRTPDEVHGDSVDGMGPWPMPEKREQRMGQQQPRRGPGRAR